MLKPAQLGGCNECFLVSKKRNITNRDVIALILGLDAQRNLTQKVDLQAISELECVAFHISHG